MDRETTVRNIRRISYAGQYVPPTADDDLMYGIKFATEIVITPGVAAPTRDGLVRWIDEARELLTKMARGEIRPTGAMLESLLEGDPKKV